MINTSYSSIDLSSWRLRLHNSDIKRDERQRRGDDMWLSHLLTSPNNSVDLHNDLCQVVNGKLNQMLQAASKTALKIPRNSEHNPSRPLQYRHQPCSVQISHNLRSSSATEWNATSLHIKGRITPVIVMTWVKNENSRKLTRGTNIWKRERKLLYLSRSQNNIFPCYSDRDATRSFHASSAILLGPFHS